VRHVGRGQRPHEAQTAEVVDALECKFAALGQENVGYRERRS